ncbi:hypothetical protein ZWY2020_011285 [Hordeum vulgare]|nr:hypothetical protein ZWY2020_011285 [Hordeum vulgare]
MRPDLDGEAGRDRGKEGLVASHSFKSCWREAREEEAEHGGGSDGARRGRRKQSRGAVRPCGGGGIRARGGRGSARAEEDAVRRRGQRAGKGCGPATAQHPWLPSVTIPPSIPDLGFGLCGEGPARGRGEMGEGGGEEKVGGEEEEGLEMEAHLLGPPARTPASSVVARSRQQVGGGNARRYPFARRFREISHLESSETFLLGSHAGRVCSELGLGFHMQISSTTKQKN